MQYFIKVVFILFIFCIYYSAIGQQNDTRVEKGKDGTVKYYVNGIKMCEGKLIDNKRHGSWTFYDTIGKLKAHESYSKGQLDGLADYYDLNTQFKTSEGEYINGKRDGIWHFYYSSTGSIYAKIDYKNGLAEGDASYYDSLTQIKYAEGKHSKNERIGEWTFYYRNDGKLKSTETYTGMVLNGPAKYYDSITGKLYMANTFSNGKLYGIAQYYDSATGYLVSELEFKDNILDGLSKVYFNDNRKMLKFNSNNTNDIENGNFVVYDSVSGNVLMEMEMNNGLKNGINKAYFLNGTLSLLSHYKNDVNHGTIECFDSLTSNKRYDGYWDMDKKTGVWNYYNCKNKKLVTTENYRNDLLHGDYFVYDSVSGKKIREGRFRNNIRTGVWKYYEPNTGNIIAEEKIKDNDTESEITWYNGKYKTAVVNYADEMKNGKCIYYYENTDKIRIEYNCKNDSLDGKFVVYYPSGKIKRAEKYESGRFVYGKCYTEKGDEVEYTPFKIKAEFIGDVMTYIGNNIRYPEEAKNIGLEGKVIVRFIVNESGLVKNAEVIKSLSKECDEEAIRIISQMPPWVPAKIDDDAIETYQTLPIVFWIH